MKQKPLPEESQQAIDLQEIDELDQYLHSSEPGDQLDNFSLQIATLPESD